MIIENGVRYNDDGTVTLCGDKVCCPTLEKLSEDTYKLTDDNGNSVILSKEQAKLVGNGVLILENKTLICG